MSSHHPKIKSQTRRIARKRFHPSDQPKKPRTLGQFDLKVAFPDQKVRWKIPKASMFFEIVRLPIGSIGVSILKPIFDVFFKVLIYKCIYIYR